MVGERHPLVSVIIPVYNGARFLKRSVGSVVAQTLRDHEIIVVDDASSDDPAASLLEFGGAVRLIRHQHNRGLSAARNTGIAHCRGDFAALLDVDDWWEPEKLAEQVRLIHAAPALGAVFCDFIHVAPDGEQGPWTGGLLSQLTSWGLNPREVGPSAYVFDESLVGHLIQHTSFMHPSTVLIRCEALTKVGSFDEALWGTQDLQMWIRLARQCQVGMVSRTLAWVEQRPDSIGHQRLRMSEDIVKLYETLGRHVPDISQELASHVRGFLAREHTALGWEYRTKGDLAAARRHYRASLRHEFRIITFLRWLRAWAPSAAPGPSLVEKP